MASAEESKKRVVSATSDTIGASTTYNCDICAFKTKDLAAFQNHVGQTPHGLYSGSYPCKICKKQVYVVPEDDPGPDEQIDKDGKKVKRTESDTVLKGLPAGGFGKSTDRKSSDISQYTKTKSAGQVAGGLGVCENCKEELRKQLV